MVEKTVLHNLNSGMVLDRSILIGLNTDDLSQQIASIRAAGAKPLYVVDSAEAFFKPQTLITLIHNNDKRVSVVNEALGGFFTAQQIEALTNAPKVIAHAGVQQPAAPAHHDDGEVVVNFDKQANYIFAQVPQGWSVGGNMSLGPTKIKRKVKNSDGDGTLFFMHPNDFEKLWMFASKAWSGAEDAPLQAKFNTGVGLKTATIQDDRISVGGNYIRRYEIEQVAKYRGWVIPGNVQVAA